MPHGQQWMSSELAKYLSVDDNLGALAQSDK